MTITPILPRQLVKRSIAICQSFFEKIQNTGNHVSRRHLLLS